MREWFTVQNTASEAEVSIFGALGSYEGGVGVADFAEALGAVPKDSPLLVRINSPGGWVADGLAIASMLRERKAQVTTRVVGLAASAATIVTSGGSDRIEIEAGALMMIHKPWALVLGDERDMAKAVDQLQRWEDSIVGAYRRHSSLSESKLRAMMADETWLDAGEAVAAGLATHKVQGDAPAAAALDSVAQGLMARFKRAPAALGGSVFDARSVYRRRASQTQLGVIR